MPDKRFHTILFDADGTLFDFKKAEKTAISATAAQYGFEVSEEQTELFSIINDRCWRKFEAGEISRDELRTMRFRIWFEEIGIYKDPKKFAQAYIDNLSRCGILFDGAIELLDTLRGNYELYIVTNGLSKTQRGRIFHSGIEHYFKKIYISEEVGFVKPQKEFFDYVLGEIGLCDSNGVLIFGDSLSSDMQGGRNAGISTCKFSPEIKTECTDLCDFEVQSYKEFLAVLD